MSQRPRFHATPVRLEFDPSIPLDDHALVAGGVAWLVGNLTELKATLTQLLDELPIFVSRYSYTARLVTITADEIVFRVSRA